MQSSRPSDPVVVDFTTKNRLCLYPRMIPGLTMSGIVTNEPGACVEGSDVIGECVGDTGVVRMEWPGVQRDSTTCCHQVETLGLMPSEVGRMSRRPSGVAS